MGKRSSYARRPHDAYATPREAVLPLIGHLRRDGIRRFAEPCCGEGRLAEHLDSFGIICAHAGDILFGQDALKLRREQLDSRQADAIITNPPWTRELRLPLIHHFIQLGLPVWLLMDADAMHNRYMAEPLGRHCTKIVSVGRVKWIAGSRHMSKDNAAWYLFQRRRTGMNGIRFFERQDDRYFDATPKLDVA